MSTFFMSNHHLLMFWWSPLGLVCVAASSSHPCSEHPRWVTFAFLESISCPIISCHRVPSIFEYRSFCVSHFCLQSYCPHPLQSWVSCCQVNHALYALTRVVICLSLNPFSRLLLLSVHQSHYYFPSCFSWGSSLPHLSRSLFCQHRLIYSRRTT